MRPANVYPEIDSFDGTTSVVLFSASWLRTIRELRFEKDYPLSLWKHRFLSSTGLVERCRVSKEKIVHLPRTLAALVCNFR